MDLMDGMADYGSSDSLTYSMIENRAEHYTSQQESSAATHPTHDAPVYPGDLPESQHGQPTTTYNLQNVPVVAADPQVAAKSQQQFAQLPPVQQQQQTQPAQQFVVQAQQAPTEKDKRLKEHFASIEQRQQEEEQAAPYLDQLWERRHSVGRMVIISLAVLLAIALNHTLVFYLKIASDRLRAAGTFRAAWWYDVLLRVSYPAIVLVVIWHMKTVVG